MSDHLTPEQIAGQLNGKRSGSGWQACCPAHDDRKASLNIGVGTDGKVLLHCKAGCTFNDITAALGARPRDLMADGNTASAPPPPKKKRKAHPTADKAIQAALWSAKQKDQSAEFETVYRYGESCRVARFTNKAFAPVHLTGEGWLVGKPPVYPIYRAADVTSSGDESLIFFTEGEKDADNLATEGVVACTMAGGADGIVRNLKAADLSPLAGRDVVLIPDNDESGRKCMDGVAGILDSVAATVRILTLPGLPDKGDVSDWLNSGGDGEALVRLAESAPPYTPLRESVAITRAKKDDPFKLTDLGNAERLVAQHGDAMRYVWTGDRSGRWYVWTGSRWQVDTAGAAMRYACGIARDILKESAAASGDTREALAKHWKKSESSRAIHSQLDLARSRPKIAVSHDVLDPDDWLFNTLTGTLDLRTGELRPHDPRDLITKLSPVAYDPAAPCPTYEKFIEQITLGRKDLIEYLERVLGYCLTGDHRHHVLPIAYGGGANGKSTLFDLALYIAGDYGTTAPESLLTESDRTEHPTEIANLQGKRLIVASETPEGSALRINLVKKLTGDAMLTGRFMRCDLFQFRRTHKLILQTNNRPRISETSNAVWRRLKLIPFDLQVAEHEQDAELPDKLQDEAPGILARWVRAAQRWIEDDFDLAEPDVVKATTADYQNDEDPLADFFDGRVEVTGNESDRIARSQFYRMYTTWASISNTKPMNDRAFYDRMRRVEGVVDKKAKIAEKSVNALLGIRLME